MPRILVLSPEAGGFWCGEVLPGVDESCAARGYQPLVVQTALSWQDSMGEHIPIDQYLRLARARVAGTLAITATCTPRELSAIGDLDGPVVAISGSPVREGGVSVVIDNVGGAKQAVKHLIEHGHRRIGFVGAFFQYDVQERYAGYVQAVEEAGFGLDTGLCFIAHDDLSAGGLEAAEQIVAAGVPATGLFVDTDLHAATLMARLREQGIRVPEDVSIIGFDDAELAQAAVPSLSSIRQAPRALGSTGANLLLDMVTGRETHKGRHVLPVTLVRRHSCGCLESHHDLLDASEDWTVPNWKERLAGVLVRALAARPDGTQGPAEKDDVWPGVDVVIDAFEASLRGDHLTSISALDQAWHEASVRTRNAEILLRLVDLLEFVGMCRQSQADNDPDSMRLKLRTFLAESRLQILRYAAIADPLGHPDAPRTTRLLIRRFLEGAGRRPTLDWLSLTGAVRGCLGLWADEAEPGCHGTLRVAGSYGSPEVEPGPVPAEEFPPAEWLDASSADGQPAPIVLIPVTTPRRDVGVLAVAMPAEHRYYDGYWGLQYGCALLARGIEVADSVAPPATTRE